MRRDDFYCTLAAYGVNTETGWAKETLRSFEQQCLIKLALGMKKINVTPEAAFTYMDSSGVGSTSVENFLYFVNTTLKTEFKDREKYALANTLDLNKTNEIKKDHFVKTMTRMMEICSDPEKVKMALENKEKPVLKPPRRVIIGLQDDPSSAEVAEANIKNIVKKLELKGPLGLFLLGALENSEYSKGSLSLKAIEHFIAEAYGTIITPSEKRLLIKMMDTRRDGTIAATDFRDVRIALR